MIKVDGKKIRQGMMMGNAVMTKAVVIGMAWHFGNKLDQRYGTSPWIMVVLMICAVTFGIWFLLFTAKRNGLSE